MTDKAWKATERKIASILGGRRVPITGRQRGDVPDVAHDWLAIEIKHKQKLPDWVKDALDQAIASNPTGSKLPVAILHESGERFDQAMVVIKLGDFVDWFVSRSEAGGS